MPFGLVRNICRSYWQQWWVRNRQLTEIAGKTGVYLPGVCGRRGKSAVKVAINQFVTPKTKRDVHSLFGLAGYYRRFIDGFSTMAAPLSDLTRKCLPEKMQWGGEQQTDSLQQAKGSFDVVYHGHSERTSIRQAVPCTNRCISIGTVLSQLEDKGEKHQIAFYSRKLLPRECCYAELKHIAPWDWSVDKLRVDLKN